MQPPHTEESQVRLRRGEAAVANAPHTSTKQQSKKQQAIGRCYGAANLPQKLPDDNILEREFECDAIANRNQMTKQNI